MIAVEVGPTSWQCSARTSDLCGKVSGVAVEVRVLGVLRGDAQGLLLAAAGDPERDAAGLQRQRAADRPVDLVVLAVQRGRAGSKVCA